MSWEINLYEERKINNVDGVAAEAVEDPLMNDFVIENGVLIKYTEATNN